MTSIDNHKLSILPFSNSTFLSVKGTRVCRGVFYDMSNGFISCEDQYRIFALSAGAREIFRQTLQDIDAWELNGHTHFPMQT
jgi:hypothetical protein